MQEHEEQELAHPGVVPGQVVLLEVKADAAAIACSSFVLIVVIIIITIVIIVIIIIITIVIIIIIVTIIISIDRFYIALFSALQQTRRGRVACDSE